MLPDDDVQSISAPNELRAGGGRGARNEPGKHLNALLPFAIIRLLWCGMNKSREFGV